MNLIHLYSSSILTGFDDLPQSPFRLRSLLKLWGSEFGGLQSMFYGFHDVLIHEHFGVKIKIMCVHIYVCSFYEQPKKKKVTGPLGILCKNLYLLVISLLTGT